MTRLAPGTAIGDDFVIERALSEGGMGAVYVAMQRSTGVSRAVKTMHGELLGDERLRARFVEEARLAATIPSDHVVKVLGAGWDSHLGLPWLAMELLRGKPLTTVLEQIAPFSPALTEKVLEQACHGLGAAAALGITHRDVKPDNLFVSPSNTVGLPFVLKVLDFGIAKQTLGSGPKSTQVVGTPFWLAPEQTDTRPRISPATDVWPIGLIAFACLTGKNFWHTAYEPEASMQAFLRELVIDEIPAASVRAAESEASVPPWFDGWFARCVARDPAARFADAREAFAAFAAAREASGDRTAVAASETARFLAALSGAPVPAAVPVTAYATPPRPEAASPAPTPRTEVGPLQRGPVATEIPRAPLPPPEARPAPSTSSRSLGILAVPALLLVLGIAYVAWPKPAPVPEPAPIASATATTSFAGSYAKAALAALSAQDPPDTVDSAAPLGSLARPNTPAPATAVPAPAPKASENALDRLDSLLVDPTAGGYTCVVGSEAPVSCSLKKFGKSYTLIMQERGRYFSGSATPAGETLMTFKGIYNDKSDPTKDMQASGNLLKVGKGWYLPATNLTPALRLNR